MLKSISLIIIPFILNIIVLGKILDPSKPGIFQNPIDILGGIAFFFSFGFGFPVSLSIGIGILILILPSYIALFIYLRRKKRKNK